ncbi:TonB family protein [candidate division KSB1 bacterium]|nr:TonB family protein [candidate division KSB1 bacterium]
MIETINQFSTVWLDYFGLAILQNTVFLGLIFLAFHIFRNESARVKYGIALIGLIKLMLPPFIPSSVWRFILPPSASTASVQMGPVTALVYEATGRAIHFTPISMLFILWLVVAVGYLLFAFLSTMLLKFQLRQATKLSTKLCKRRKVHLFETDKTTIPLSVGLFPNRIFLPANWRQLPEECRQVLLEHEIAHLERRDGPVQLLQIMVQALYLFHPLVWLLNERLNEYREMACDDEAIHRARLSPLKYSRYLVYLAERMTTSRWSHLSASALIKRRNKLLNRVNYQMKEKSMKPSGKKITAFLTGLIVLMLPLSFYLGTNESAVEFAELSAHPVAGTAGKIYGIVVDKESGKPLAGCNVILVGTKSGAATDAEGNYFIPNIPAGSHTLKVSMMGYKSVLMEKVIVNASQSTRLNFKMQEAVIAAGENSEAAEMKMPPPPKGAERNVMLKELQQSVENIKVLAEKLGMKATVSLTPDSANKDASFVPYDVPPAPKGGWAAIAKLLKYPKSARKAGETGTVLVKTHIDEKGNILEAKGISGPENKDLWKAAEEAVLKSKWEPAKQRDKAIAVWVTVPVKFNLD